MTLRAHIGVTGAFFSDSVYHVYLWNDVWEGYKYHSSKKRLISIFSHWLIMERSQTLPDLRSLISKFRDKHFEHTVTLINRWKFQGDRSVGVAMTRIATFFWGEVFWRDLVTWPWELWVWNLHMCKKKMHEQVCQKRRRGVVRYLRKTAGEVFTPSPPGPARAGGGAIFYSFLMRANFCHWFASRARAEKMQYEVCS